MSKLGKYDVRFLTYIQQEYYTKFKTFDDYINYLYYTKCEKRDEFYYETLEKDIRGFVEWQEEQMKRW